MHKLLSILFAGSMVFASTVAMADDSAGETNDMPKHNSTRRIVNPQRTPTTTVTNGTATNRETQAGDHARNNTGRNNTESRTTTPAPANSSR